MSEIPAGVKKIPGLMTDAELSCLCRMVRSASSIVELGTYKGRSLAAMLLANPKAKAWAVDWFGDMSSRGYKGSTLDETRANFEKLGVKPAGILVGTTTEVAPTFTERVDLLHVDAGHSYEECLADLNDWAPKVRPGGAICVHDYGEPHNPKLSRPGVQQAVDEWRGLHPEWVEVERAGTMIAFRNIIAEEGALYIVYGEKAVHQAQQSLASLKMVAPKVKVAAIHDGAFKGADINIIHVEVDKGARAQKTRMYSLSPFRRTLFLDADTKLLDSPATGFGLLQYGDVVLAQDRIRIFSQQEWPGLDPDELETTKRELPAGAELCYYNSGVFFFSRSERNRRMFQTWHEEWLRWQRQDQPALMRAIQREPVKIVSMRAPWNTHIGGAAKFVHHMHRTASREGAPK